MRTDSLHTFHVLRERYPVFTYHGFDFEVSPGGILSYGFDFRAGEDLRFTPKMRLFPGKYAAESMDPLLLKGLVFHIGMIELISYWKCVCSPRIHIVPCHLDEEQLLFWEKLYQKGLGEFFYQNSIPLPYPSLFTFSFAPDAPGLEDFPYKQIPPSRKVIVPIGGGKDSVVTLEKLKEESREIIPFIINPREATLACAEIAGFPCEDDRVVLRREIDPLLLERNRQGFLNGHTPFSAMLAFHSLLAACVTGTRDIALSNESSANEPTIPGTDINHQYSKSEEFEGDFQAYVRSYMNDIAHYYSFLRPFNELRIGEMFASYPDYFPVFRSCNAGSKENRWCGACPKCLFTAIILAPFIPEAPWRSIFGEDLLDKPSLEHYFRELTGMSEHKPFECVGTVEEVNRALSMVQEPYKDKYLMKIYRQWKKRDPH